MSSSGAYGDFPSYYYERGNLFGSYLLGHIPAQSWDVRTEIKYLGTSGIPDAPTRRVQSPRRAPRVPQKPPTSELSRYVRNHVSPAGAARILLALQAQRRATVAATGDSYESLDEYIVGALTPEEQQIVLVRLKLAAIGAERERSAKERQKRKRSKSRPAQAGARRESAPAKPRNPGRPLVRAAPKAPKPLRSVTVPSTCAMCGATLSETERARSARLHAIFLGQAYCTQHADKVEGLLSSKGRSA